MRFELMLLATCVTLSVVTGGNCPAARQPVKSLPGVDSLRPYEFYSGYLDAGVPPSGKGHMCFHYICAMAPDWENKPVMLWYNGGPGAPSTYGLFQEFGPFLLSDLSFDTDDYKKTGIPSPMRNEFTWANLTSICEIDSPAPMGASFCTEGNGTNGSKGGPGGDAYTCGPWTDMSVASANHQAHKAFFHDAWPEFIEHKNSVTIVGESYAGIYIPYFIKAWLKEPVQGVNLIGFAIGDGCTACVPMEGRVVNWCIDLNSKGLQYPNSLPGPWWDLEFFHGHSQFSSSLKKQIISVCSEAELKGILPPSAWTDACAQLIRQVGDEVGYFYAYNLFESCPDLTETANGIASASIGRRQRRLVQNRLSFGSSLATYGDGDSGLGAPCLMDSMLTWFSRTETKEAFGIPKENKFIVLDNGIGMNYTIDAPFVGPIYEAAVKAGLRIMVYEGDSDASGLSTLPMEDIWVPFFGNGSGEWTPAGRLLDTDPNARPLHLPLTQSWRPFGLLGGRKVQAGYVMEWADGNVSFVSIRGAGHLVPTYRPAAAYAIMEAFLKGDSLPPGLPPPRI